MPLVFIDHEASSLERGSFPIEIAWVFEDGTGESHLIRPHASWHGWSPASQALHGISPGSLKREGEVPLLVAKRAMEALAGHTIVADQPAWDAVWLNRLLETAELPPVTMKSLADIEVQACYPLLSLLAPEGSPGRTETMLHVRALATEAINGARDAELKIERVRHRALPDAEGNRRIWLEVKERVAAALAREQTAQKTGKVR